MTDQPTLEHLTALFNQRAWPQALALARTLKADLPPHPMLYYIAGIASLEMQQLPEAIDSLGRAATMAPDNAEFAVHHAKALVLARRTRDARQEADRALALAPGRAQTLDTLGVVYTQIAAHDQAVEVFRQAASSAPGHAVYHYNLATAMVAVGDIDGAEREIEACLALEPRYWRAHLTLAQLRRQTPVANHVARLEAVLGEVGPDAGQTQAQVCLNMALAKELEDLGEYARALDHMARGKAAAGKGRDYRIARDEQLFSALQARFPEPPPPSRGCASEEPLFVVGMPRTGTTLVERIISSHPDVHSAGEMLNFGMALKFMSGTHTRSLLDIETVAGTRHVDFRTLGQTYLDSTRPATGRTPHFVDKLPHNFLYVGYIAQALPNAKIVCLRRNPMDTCLSNFRQLFAPNSPYFDYSFDLLDTGRYYILFDAMMRHWQRVFPGRVLEVDYEALVDDQERMSRRIIEFCALPWHEDCLRFEANPSPVATASAVQVRAPIYRSALQRWRKYGEALAPLRELLVGAGIEV
ncbi:MAG: sulfotransferase [Rhodanobacter sp. SCN 67-45]|nr:MAG: sulfotransferase [Rhodanobacter sp. SCN 67-45]